MLQRALVTLALALWAALPAAAQQPPPMPQPAQGPRQLQLVGEDPIGRNLFPPELIMRYQQEIALTPEQRTTITKAIQEFQLKIVELQWQMQDETQRLNTSLDKASIALTPALAQLDQMLNVEREVKRAHIGLLIKLKNTLTEEQQAKLAAYRK